VEGRAGSKNIEKDAALERRFQPVMVPEPTVAEATAILRGLRDRGPTRVGLIPFPKSGHKGHEKGSSAVQVRRAWSPLCASNTCCVEMTTADANAHLRRSVDEGPSHPPAPGVDRYETHHALHYTDDALQAAAKLSTQYINDRSPPVDLPSVDRV